MAGDGFRAKVLKGLYSAFPFDLSGDCVVPPACDGIKISCVINFFGRLDLLSGILHSLAGQTMSRKLFEVVLVEDRGGTDEGKRCAESFSPFLQVRYMPLGENFGKMGYSRNQGLAGSRGEIVLFLDDDTVILQQDFLERLDREFFSRHDMDAVVPWGRASYALIANRYDYHDPFFMTSRCTAYRRSLLADLRGFMSDFVGQEDVEFVIRFLLAGKSSINVAELCYYHPPLLVPNFRKPKAVGHSFYLLKSRYPLVIWLVTVLNCARHAPLYLIPARRCREMGRFGIGFIAGVLTSPFKRKGFQYG